MSRIQITALVGRATSGVSICPFICEDHEGGSWFVKPSGSLRESLISEWLGARLANELGLPLPRHAIAEVPEGLSNAEGASELRPGPAFASESLAPGATDLMPHDLGRVRPEILAESLVFDAWIRNADRQLGPTGGNPNAMLVSPGSRFFLIDHDNAFDPAFDAKTLMAHHPGREQAAAWLDPGRRADWTGRARKAFDKIEQFWQELPPEWVEEEEGPAPGIEDFLARVLDILRHPFDLPADFWRTLDPTK